jgi:hypothetical protein
MQKVEGSNPFSRSQKGTHLQAFFACAVGLCVCVGSDRLRTRRWPIVGRSKKNGLFAGRFWFVRTEVLLRACRRSGVRPAAAVTPTPAATARSCGQRPPARDQRSRSFGRVRFQSGNRARSSRGAAAGVAARCAAPQNLMRSWPTRCSATWILCSARRSPGVALPIAASAIRVQTKVVGGMPLSARPARERISLRRAGGRGDPRTRLG